MRFHMIPVPDEVAEELLESGTKRIVVRIGDQTSRRALQGKEGERCIVIGKAALSEFGLSYGDKTEVEVWPDAQPHKIDICEEFREALAQDDAARARWETFPEGKQRSLAYHVNSAKQEATRIRRALEVTEKIRTHTLHRDQ